MDFEIYESTEGKKRRFFVVPIGKYLTDDIVRYAKRFFKVSEDKLTFAECWLIDDCLFLCYPDNTRAKQMMCVFVNTRRLPLI